MSPMRILLILAMILIWNQDGFAERIWVQFQLPEGNLRTRMPSKPEHREETVSSPVGDIKEHLFTSTVEDGYYTVEFSKLPWKAVHFASDKHIYRNAKGDLLKAVMGKEISFEATQNGEINGMELHYEAPAKEGHPGYHGMAQLYLEGRSFYVLNFMISKEIPKDQLSPFFESLEIKKS